VHYHNRFRNPMVPLSVHCVQAHLIRTNAACDKACESVGIRLRDKVLSSDGQLVSGHFILVDFSDQVVFPQAAETVADVSVGRMEPSDCCVGKLTGHGGKQQNILFQASNLFHISLFLLFFNIFGRGPRLQTPNLM
jgi:hypothetical protein